MQKQKKILLFIYSFNYFFVTRIFSRSYLSNGRAYDMVVVRRRLSVCRL